MKFTVLYGKRVARLELPPTVTLTELSEGLAERFNLQDPTALKFRLQEGQPSVRVRDYPDATLESAGAEGWRTGGCTSVGVVRFQDRLGVFVSVCRVTENQLNSGQV